METSLDFSLTWDLFGEAVKWVRVFEMFEIPKSFISQNYAANESSKMKSFFLFGNEEEEEEDMNGIADTDLELPFVFFKALVASLFVSVGGE